MRPIANANEKPLPLVSIITPSYNQGRWLPENLESVAAQTYPRIEHIVIDGGSNDGTIGILEQTSRRVRWVSERDEGQSHAINKGFRLARGAILGWVNSDDAYIDRRAVEAAVEVFERLPDVVVVYGHAAVINADSGLIQLFWSPPFLYRLLPIANYICQPAAFVRRSALGTSLVDERYQTSMDRELWLRLGAGHRAQRVNMIVAADRHHLARKSIAQPGMSRHDEELLIRDYQVPRNDGMPKLRAAIRIAFRVAGLTLLLQLGRTPLAFRCTIDSYLQLARRQLFVRRAKMPGVV